MTDEKCQVIEHRELGSGYRFISFDAPAIAGTASPGQFVHVRVPGLESSALRRPFSIFNAEDGRLELLYKTVGRGTAALNAVKPGDKVKTSQVLGTVDTIAGETVFHFEIWDDRTIPQNPEIWLRPR